MREDPSSPQPTSPKPIVITFCGRIHSCSAAKLALRSDLATDPADHVARILLACILDAEGDEEDARFLLWQGILIQPGEPAIYYKLAEMLDGCGRTQEALDLLEELFNRAECCPTEAKPRLDRARDLYARLQPFLAEENCEAAGERWRPSAPPSSSLPAVRSTSASSCRARSPRRHRPSRQGRPLARGGRLYGKVAKRKIRNFVEEQQQLTQAPANRTT
jgi:hypothetical protein